MILSIYLLGALSDIYFSLGMIVRGQNGTVKFLIPTTYHMGKGAWRYKSVNLYKEIPGYD